MTKAAEEWSKRRAWHRKGIIAYSDILDAFEAGHAEGLAMGRKEAEPLTSDLVPNAGPEVYEFEFIFGAGTLSEEMALKLHGKRTRVRVEVLE